MPRAKAVTEEAVFDQLDSRDRDEHPFMTASQIEEDVDASLPTVVDRLESLEERGRVRAVEIGPARVWLTAEDHVAGSTATDGGLMIADPEAYHRAADRRDLIEKFAVGALGLWVLSSLAMGLTVAGAFLSVDVPGAVGLAGIVGTPAALVLFIALSVAYRWQKRAVDELVHEDLEE